MNMKASNRILFIAFLSGLFLLVSCKKMLACKEENISSAGSSAQNGGTVELYTEPNGGGTLKYTIAIDAKGNFYSTANISYSGLYPKVTSPSGASIYMNSPLSSGACNSCHGPSTSKLGLD